MVTKPCLHTTAIEDFIDLLISVDLQRKCKAMF